MKTIFFYITIILFAVGCSKNNNSSSGYATDVFPDKVGDTWTYLVNDTSIYSYNQQPNIITQYNMNVSIINSTQLTILAHGLLCMYRKT